MENKVQTIVQGEAPESDEDEIPTHSQEKTTMQVLDDVITTKAAAPVIPKAVVISGEASESDEEIDTSHSTDLPPLNVDKSGRADEDLIIVNTTAIPGEDRSHLLGHGLSKYDSLLHRKLRERNIAFRRHIVDSVQQLYLSSAKDLHNIRLQLHKTQSYLTDVTHNMSLCTNDLYKVDNTLDTITTCTILPDISFPE